MAPSPSQHQNRGRLVVSSSREGHILCLGGIVLPGGYCFIWVFSPSETGASNYLADTHFARANSRGKPESMDRCHSRSSAVPTPAELGATAGSWLSPVH